MTYKPAYPKPLKKKRKAKPKITQPEANIQEMAEQYCHIHDIPFLRLSDTLMRALFANPNIPVYIKKILSDELKGFADMCLFDKDTQRYMAIEIKTERGKLSHAQAAWQRRIGTVVTHGLDETIKAIDKFKEECANGQTTL